MQGVFVEEADVWRWFEFRKGIGPARLLELLRGMSEEDQDTFKRDMGPHGGDDEFSVEGDYPPIGVRVEDLADTPCL